MLHHVTNDYSRTIKIIEEKVEKKIECSRREIRHGVVEGHGNWAEPSNVNAEAAASAKALCGSAR
jgi:hypothetical protein